MRVRFNSLYVSSSLLTLCLLGPVPYLLWQARKWPRRNIVEEFTVGQNVNPCYNTCYNWESLFAIASLAFTLTALIVLWTSYRKGMRSAWFIMFVFVFGFYLPAAWGDIFLYIRDDASGWWHGFAQGVWQGNHLAVLGLKEMFKLAVMLFALFLPVRTFFGKPRQPRSSDQLSS